MTVRSLASSSKGNAYIVEEGGLALIIDDGLPYRTFKSRLEKACPDAPAFLAVLVTHNHGDHVHGLKPLLSKHPELPIYANAMTAEAVVAQEKVDEGAFACFENGQEFEIGPFSVRAFSIPHDTVDPVGFVVRCGETTYFHGTDIGTPLDAIGVKLAEADIATLESNHDPVMLRRSGRPSTLIQRIAGPRGHLANHQAAMLVRKFASPRLKRLMLAHLSADCNAPQLARETMAEALAEMKRGDIELEVLAP